jgi:hypothetical protein
MFRILLGPFDNYYGSFSESLYSMFEIGILGFADRTQFQKTQSPVLTMIMFVLLVLIVLIVALVSITCLAVLLKTFLGWRSRIIYQNGYIALLGGSYANVQANEAAQRRYQKAT